MLHGKDSRFDNCYGGHYEGHFDYDLNSGIHQKSQSLLPKIVFFRTTLNEPKRSDYAINYVSFGVGCNRSLKTLWSDFLTTAS